MILHEQYETRDGDPVYFECAECGFRSQSLGGLHAHVEGHWNFLGWIRWHLIGWITSSDGNKWMNYTNVVKVTDTDHVSLDDVKGL